MNRAQETQLAWALLDAAAFLDDDARTWLCVKIGAGEQRCAVKELMQVFACHDITLDPGISAQLRAWAFGFLGTQEEVELRALASGVCSARHL